jgi:hypothetical protein
MSNITISIDEQTYRAARIFAAQRNSTVSALVRDYLNSLMASQQPDSRAQDLFSALDKARGFNTSDRLTRDQAHER